MINNEANLRDSLRAAAARENCKSKHLEDSLNSGIPDLLLQAELYRSTFMVECKYIAAWPVRPGTRVRLRHFSPSQIAFLKTWHSTYVVLSVGADEVLTFTGPVFAELYSFGELPTSTTLLRCALHIIKNDELKSRPAEALRDVIHRLVKITCQPL